jgi:hypothetical protein
VNFSIVASYKQIIGSSAYTSEIVLQCVERVSVCLEAPEDGRGTHIDDGGAIVRNLDLRNLKEIESFLLQHQLVCIQDPKNVRYTEVRAISLEPTPSGDDECNDEASGERLP